MTEFLIFIMLLLVGVLLGASYPNNFTISSLAEYSTIASGGVTVLSFLLAITLYLKWKKPIDSADTKALIDSINNLSDSSRICAIAILDCGDSASRDEYRVLKNRLINELSCSVVKVKTLEVVICRSHIFSSDTKLISKCSDIDKKLHKLVELTPYIHDIKQRQLFVDLNTECMTYYYDFCNLLLRETKRNH